ncbi:uncharacterized protein VP01_3552g3 [Puccinia sorghi]|uniref:Uncharacterized protein n=1 Tax=Puccinia sorghi TaxID=27349 RepID=A0A0L6UVE0_9BASI|nr:uncharacterized protein VP01_3552g3 [Puccinia sorghi]
MFNFVQKSLRFTVLTGPIKNSTKGLLTFVTKSSHITEEPAVLVGAAAEAVNKKQAETVNILMNYMSETTFEAIITPDNEESPYEIWSAIVRCGAYIGKGVTAGLSSCCR